MTNPLKVIIGIATAGRREQMSLTMAQLARQTRVPERIVVCPANMNDYDETASDSVECVVQLVRGPQGLTAQRNAILDACDDADLLLFIDDDFYPAPNYLEQMVRVFEDNPGVVVTTNHPALDGATGPGVAHDAALRAIDEMSQTAGVAPPISTTYGGYGCNLAVRMAPVREHGVWFDENLPLYGWLEDIDFSRRMAPHGRIVKCPSLKGVHLGTKKGRTSGLRFGYSQIANPLYMVGKGSMSRAYAFRQLGKNVASNIVRSFAPEPWVDRAGRLAGNRAAIVDLIAGKLRPERIMSLPLSVALGDFVGTPRRGE